MRNRRNRDMTMIFFATIVLILFAAGLVRGVGVREGACARAGGGANSGAGTADCPVASDGKCRGLGLVPCNGICRGCPVNKLFCKNPCAYY
jgi:hypothetical protein